MDTDRITALEEQVAHLTRALDDMSDILRRHETEIDRLSRRVLMLMEREAEREFDNGALPIADAKPPHW